MRTVVASIESEFRRYKALGEGAMAQASEAQLCAGQTTAMSIAMIVWHVSGNLRSRFTDFLTTDGEKPWRQREEEFEARQVTRDALLARWQSGWDVLTATLATLQDADLARVIHVRGQGMSALEALHRSLAHISYHVGQMVYVAKAQQGEGWHSLSIPLGQSAAYNAAPTHERPEAHAARLGTRP